MIVCTQLKSKVVKDYGNLKLMTQLRVVLPFLGWDYHSFYKLMPT